MHKHQKNPAAHKQFLTAYTKTYKVCVLHRRAMTKNKYHLTDNDHIIYLGEISWKVPVTPQVNSPDTQFISIIDGSSCLEREVQIINICHIVTGFQWSGEAFFNNLKPKICTPLEEVEWILKSREYGHTYWILCCAGKTTENLGR